MKARPTKSISATSASTTYSQDQEFQAARVEGASLRICDHGRAVAASILRLASRVSSRHVTVARMSQCCWSPGEYVFDCGPFAPVGVTTFAGAANQRFTLTVALKNYPQAAFGALVDSRKARKVAETRQQ
jgi:hypothetical protein